jgi:hypothetical protein
MATYTPNLNLKKPLGGEKYDVVADLNDSKDKIDVETGLLRSQTAQAIGKSDMAILKADSMASGSPKGLYATLVALQTAYPTGTTGAYLVTEDGKWYFWNGTSWTPGGTYQSTGISSNAVSVDKLDDTAEVLSMLNTLDVINASVRVNPVSGGAILSPNGYTVPVGQTGFPTTMYIDILFDALAIGKPVTTISKIKCPIEVSLNAGVASSTSGCVVSKFYKNGYLYIIGKHSALPADRIITNYIQGDGYYTYLAETVVAHESSYGITDIAIHSKIKSQLDQQAPQYSFPVDRDKFIFDLGLLAGAVKSPYGFTIPTGQTGNNTSLHLKYYPTPQLVGKSALIKFYVRTNLLASDLNKFDFLDSAEQLGTQLVVLSKKFNFASYTLYDSIIMTSNTVAMTEDKYFEVVKVTMEPQNNESYLTLLSTDNINPKMTIIEVSKGFNINDDGFGTTKFNDLITAHNLITNSSERNQFKILVHPGTYDEWETVWAGSTTEDDGIARGILCKDYVYYEAIDITHPENYILSWDGHAGFPVDYIMTAEQAMTRSLFQIGTYPTHTHLKGFTFRMKNGRYCVHPETAGAGNGNEWSIENCIFDWLGCDKVIDNWQGNTLGIGISCGEIGRIKNCKWTANGLGNISGHNNGWSFTHMGGAPFLIPGAKLIFENCDFGNREVRFDTYSVDANVHDTLDLINCKGISHGYFGFQGGQTIQNWRANVIASDITTDDYEKSNNFDALVVEYNALKAELEQEITDGTASVDALQVLEADYAAKALALETTYAPRLGSVESSLAAKAPQTDVGTLANLLTTAKTNLVAAINELFNNKANKAQESWITPTLLNGWTAALPIAYRKDQFGVVHLKGAASTGIVGSNIFLLPLGYRPLQFSAQPCLANNLFGRMTIATDGSVYLSTGSNINVYLDNISFKTT